MNLTKILFLPYLLGCAAFACAQKVTISGYVTEKKSGETIPGAIVYVPELNAGTATNTFGFYSLTIPGDSAALLVSTVGYAPAGISLSLTRDTSISFQLE